MAKNFSKLSWIIKLIRHPFKSIIVYIGRWVGEDDYDYIYDFSRMTAELEKEMGTKTDIVFWFDSAKRHQIEYFSLFEDRKGSHLPYPLAPNWMKWLFWKILAVSMKFKRKIRKRGIDFYFYCPQCKKRSFYSYRQDICYACKLANQQKNNDLGQIELMKKNVG